MQEDAGARARYLKKALLTRCSVELHVSAFVYERGEALVGTAGSRAEAWEEAELLQLSSLKA